MLQNGYKSRNFHFYLDVLRENWIFIWGKVSIEKLALIHFLLFTFYLLIIESIAHLIVLKMATLLQLLQIKYSLPSSKEFYDLKFKYECLNVFCESKLSISKSALRPYLKEGYTPVSSTELSPQKLFYCWIIKQSTIKWS